MTTMSDGWNMQRLISTLMMLFVPAIVVACAPQTENTFRGQMLLWHSLDNETEQAVLDEVLGRFMDIYEDVNIITQAVPRDSLLERYRTAAESGLGPDLMIGESRWVQELAEDHLIRDLTPLEPRVDIYFSGAVASLRYTVEEESRIYGLPFALRPVALYYNTDLVTQPATTLDALLADAADGQRVAVDTRFINSYWGTPAFGGRLFDDSGRTVLDEGGFANWLTWLSSAQSSPGMFLSRDAAAILDLFQRERVAYMIATPDNLQMLKQTMGEEKISVALLPSGPVGEAGPLLRVDGLMLNASSSANQAELALLLARFLTNADQGGVFVRQSGIIPANRR
ncbi:MAG: extracellular solute-binding protein, partial [Chloroflexota bacterium]